MTARAREFVALGLNRIKNATARQIGMKALHATPNARACHPKKAADPRVSVTVELVDRIEPTCRVCRALLEEARREGSKEEFSPVLTRVKP